MMKSNDNHFEKKRKGHGKLNLVVLWNISKKKKESGILQTILVRNFQSSVSPVFGNSIATTAEKKTSHLEREEEKTYQLKL